MEEKQFREEVHEESGREEEAQTVVSKERARQQQQW